MFFFQKFPKIQYNTTEFGGNTTHVINRTVPNMTVKLEIRALDDESVPYEPYQIKDKDRPDTIAAQMYGSSRYAWVVLLANNMRDWYDWPLTDLQFYDYMNQKYESSSGANDGVSVSQGTVSQYIQLLPEDQEIVVDATAYTLLTPTARRIVTVYEAEAEANDARRNIRLVTLDALPTILTQFNAVMAK